jgi:hypothetical protein
MQVIVNLPDDVVAQLQIENGDIERAILENIALEGYRSARLTSAQIRRMLGFTTRMQVDEFLKLNGIYLEYTDEDLAHEAETSRLLQSKIG